MKYKFLPFVLFFLFSFTTTNKINSLYSKTNATSVLSKEIEAESLYHKLNCNEFELPNLNCFTEAITGFYELKQKGLIEKDIITLIDFSLSSNVKRLWIIDLATNSVLMNTFVAHGMNTGEEFATSFSNATSSFKSSLGFYSTGEIYTGKHGLSLKLDGLEKGVNDNARERGIVMHAADYVSTSFIKNNNRLGRSQGCPAIPEELTPQIIQMIKNKSCLFIYHPSRTTSSKV
jgi:hypothetical protein